MCWHTFFRLSNGPFLRYNHLPDVGPDIRLCFSKSRTICRTSLTIFHFIFRSCILLNAYRCDMCNNLTDSTALYCFPIICRHDDLRLNNVYVSIIVMIFSRAFLNKTVKNNGQNAIKSRHALDRVLKMRKCPPMCNITLFNYTNK